MFILASTLIAQRIYNPQIGGRLANLVGWQFVQRIVTDLVGLTFLIAVVAFIFIIFYGGIRWITASGDKAALESAKSTITNGIIGLVILFLIYVLIQLISIIFRINIGGLGVPSGPGGPGVPSPTSGPVTIAGPCIVGGSSCECTCPSGYSPISLCDQSTYPSCSTSCECFSVNAPPLPNGSSCLADRHCQSGFCGSGLDNDIDGYHQGAVTSGICMPGPADCNDNDALVHPNQFQYFQTPIAGSINDYNYDCADSDGNGDLNDRWPTLNCQGNPIQVACQTTMPTNYASEVGLTYGGVGRVPACGESFMGYVFWSCFAYENNSCTMYPGFFNPGCYGGCQGPLSEWGNPVLTWNIDWAPALFSSGGYTAMPCK